MDQLDAFLEPVKVHPVSAPFPPITPGLLGIWRSFLRVLGIRKPGTFRIVLDEMDFKDTNKYIMLLIDCSKVVADGLKKQTPNIFENLKVVSENNYEINKRAPELFCLATKINDPAFFAALKPTEAQKLEEAISEANPTIAAFKKKLSTSWMALIGDLEEALGQNILTSSFKDTK